VVVVVVRLTPVPIISTPKMQDMEKHVSRLQSFLCACCPAVISVVRETYRSWKQRSDDICKISMIKRMSEVVKLQLSVCSLYRFLMTDDNKLIVALLIPRVYCMLGHSSIHFKNTILWSKTRWKTWASQRIVAECTSYIWQIQIGDEGFEWSTRGGMITWTR
jgi:hypothetical protein